MTDAADVYRLEQEVRELRAENEGLRRELDDQRHLTDLWRDRFDELRLAVLELARGP